MLRLRPRVLVVSEAKGLAETIWRGLSGIRSFDAEIDVSLSEEGALRQIEISRYHLVVAGFENGCAEESPLLSGLPENLPAVAVAGGSDPRRPRIGHAIRVPLPLSFLRLEEAVKSALGRRDDRDLLRRESAG
jgi:hypothetical protein